MEANREKSEIEARRRKRHILLLKLLLGLAILGGAGYFWLSWTFHLLPAELRAGAPGTQEMTDADYRYAAFRYRWANAEEEVERSLALTDKSPIGVMGIGMAAPGFTREEFDYRNVKFIPYTSDAITSSAHGAYCDAAWDYAERYNRALEQRLKK